MCQGTGVKTQFEVWDCNFPRKGPHPVVLISHPDRCARAQVLNVLFCTSQRQSRKPYPFEVMLDMEDGLDWETFCDCSILWSVDTPLLITKRGRVTFNRRQAIREKVREMLRLSAAD
jgi:mRNA-degrading endonuclease toxin of MazEF toxin-antitoxin module